MLLESGSAHEDEVYASHAENATGTPVVPALEAFKDYLERSGRICPQPWCWKRFFVLFKPAQEPPWLSSWWVTSTPEKKNIFLQQMEYLAHRTDHFHAACRFLQDLDREHWLFKPDC